MKCPTCGAWTSVVETRARATTDDVRRRYECANMHRFTTIEKVIQFAQNHTKGGKNGREKGDAKEGGKTNAAGEKAGPGQAASKAHKAQVG